MRIAIASDIHFHLPWLDRYKRLVDEVAAREPDLLVLAGDTGEPLSAYENALALYANAAPQRVALSGNHDVWQRSEDHTSLELWETILPETAAQHGYHWLEDENLSFGSLGLCGTVGWYDYSSANDSLGISIEEYGRIKPMLSNDGRYINWPWSDREFAEMVGERFMGRLDQLEHDDAIQEILVVTHVPPFAECLRYPDNTEKAVVNAYYGNVTLGERLLTTTKVHNVVSGHVHRDCAYSKARENGDEIVVRVVPSDYGKPAALILDTETWDVEKIRITEEA